MRYSHLIELVQPERIRSERTALVLVRTVLERTQRHHHRSLNNRKKMEHSLVRLNHIRRRRRKGQRQ